MLMFSIAYAFELYMNETIVLSTLRILSSMHAVYTPVTHTRHTTHAFSDKN